MILTKEVLVTVSGKPKKYYEELGYKLPYTKDIRGRIGIKKGTKILVNVKDLPPSCNVKIQYKCDDCGIIKEVIAHTIFNRKNSQFNKDEKTYCSDCANHRMSGENNSQYKHGSIRYPQYRHNALRRNLEFNLTAEQFKSITEQKCYYCNGYSQDRDPRFIGNGIDRKNSNLGYVIENCVPCCVTCNFIKNNMDFNEFIDYIRRLYEQTKDYEL
jgi:hypothetical protein